MTPDASDTGAPDADPLATSTELREHIGELLKDMQRLQEESERLRLESEERARVVKIRHKSGDGVERIVEPESASG
jgi:hypothetical protein